VKLLILSYVKLYSRTIIYKWISTDRECASIFKKVTVSLQLLIVKLLLSYKC